MNRTNDKISDQHKTKHVKELAKVLCNVGPNLTERLIKVGINTQK